MNWLYRTSQIVDINQASIILKQVYENQGQYSDINSAIKMLQEIGYDEKICELIKDLTISYGSIDPGASQKGQRLAGAAGCVGFDASLAPQPVLEQSGMPVLEDQEKPLDMPSVPIE